MAVTPKIMSLSSSSSSWPPPPNNTGVGEMLMELLISVNSIATSVLLGIYTYIHTYICACACVCVSHRDCYCFSPSPSPQPFITPGNASTFGSFHSHGIREEPFFRHQQIKQVKQIKRTNERTKSWNPMRFYFFLSSVVDMEPCVYNCVF